MNVQVKEHTLRTFVTYLLVHIHQKKIEIEITAKIASVNRPLLVQCCYGKKLFSLEVKQGLSLTGSGLQVFAENMWCLVESNWKHSSHM